MISPDKKRLVQSVAWILAALLVASLRNIPVLSIMPLAVGLIECLILVCIMASFRQTGWQASAVIGVIMPVCMWLRRFADGYMVPVYILSNLTITGCLVFLMRIEFSHLARVLVTTVPAFCVLLIGSSAAIWLVKGEGILRALIIAWNTGLYSVVSMIGASLICELFGCLKARAKP